MKKFLGLCARRRCALVLATHASAQTVTHGRDADWRGGELRADPHRRGRHRRSRRRPGQPGSGGDAARLQHADRHDRRPHPRRPGAWPARSCSTFPLPRRPHRRFHDDVPRLANGISSPARRSGINTMDDMHPGDRRRQRLRQHPHDAVSGRRNPRPADSRMSARSAPVCATDCAAPWRTRFSGSSCASLLARRRAVSRPRAGARPRALIDEALDHRPVARSSRSARGSTSRIASGCPRARRLHRGRHAVPARRPRSPKSGRARAIARSASARRSTRSAIAPASIELLVELTFHPQNTFVGVPAYDVSSLPRLRRPRGSMPREVKRIRGSARGSRPRRWRRPTVALPNAPGGAAADRRHDRRALRRPRARCRRRL